MFELCSLIFENMFKLCSRIWPGRKLWLAMSIIDQRSYEIPDWQLPPDCRITLQIHRMRRPVSRNFLVLRIGDPSNIAGRGARLRVLAALTLASRTDK